MAAAPAVPAGVPDDSTTVPIRIGQIPTVQLPAGPLPVAQLPAPPSPTGAVSAGPAIPGPVPAGPVVTAVPVARAGGRAGGNAPMPMLGAPRRVTVVAPTSRIDVALPAQCTVAELVPMLVGVTGAAADPAAPGQGWRLRRLGGPALPPESTVAGAEIRDGELLQLVSDGGSGGGPIFDDLVDALASAVQDRPGRWSAAVSRRIAAALAAVGFAAAGVLVTGVAPVAAAALALVLLLAGGALARAGGQSRIGAAVASGGLVAAFSAGAAFGGWSAGLAPSAGTVAPGLAPSAGSVAVGLAVAAGYAVLAAVLVADQVAWFAATAGAAAGGSAIAVTVLLAGVSPVAAAAVAVVVVLVVSPAFPQLALRLARLPLPRIPADVAAFRADEEPTPGDRVADRARVAETALTAMLAGMSAIVVGCAAALLPTGNRWAWLLVGCCGLGMWLRSRAYLSIGQRCAVLAGAALALAGTGLRLLAAEGGTFRLWVLAAVLAVAVVAVVHAIRVVGPARSPYGQRLLDVLEFCCLAALVPVALAVLGVYPAVRGLGG
ncbi:type VII secretion integral membrane protein EccD [Solwaraspora sp. WMMD1047]|uniref:type VII secretion integral membrane protein EccD n=1 Tax=Solwaraspora sp. WMMD1047 TaxID=3016102 RepID=UPI002415DA94|nr:type VII secretion integral membrane protein EccD [Solwaraspora sp. WMMD1047]MDG4829505.1 type VII secretion integral membrane protein EccD [Solwaraspora sp. WMMD1047]